MEGEKAGVGNKPGSVNDNHSSGTAVTDCLLQPTRESARNRRCGQAAYSPIWSCSRRGLPCRELLPVARCALTAPFHPYRQGLEDNGRRYIFCGTFHGLTPPRRYLAPCPKEPGLSSASFWRTAIVWPTPALSGANTTAKRTRQERPVLTDLLTNRLVERC